jgi:hypothetical protein
MPLYRFKGPLTPDPEPMELPDDEAAWGEVVKWCGEVLRDIDGHLPPGTAWSFRVANSADVDIIEVAITARRLDQGS